MQTRNTLRDFIKHVCNNWFSVFMFILFLVYYLLILINILIPKFHFLEHEINLIYYLTKHPALLFIYIVSKALISSFVISKTLSLMIGSLKTYFWTMFLTFWVIAFIAQFIGICFLLKSHFLPLYHAPPMIFH